MTTKYDVFEISYSARCRTEIEIARSVSARVASELSGLPRHMFEDQVVKHGEMGILHGGEQPQELLIRRTRQ